MGLYLLSRGPHCESPWTNGQITSGQWRLGSRGTRSYQEPGSRGTTFIGPSPLYFTTVPPSLGNPPPRANPSRFCTLPLPESSATPSSARKADSPLHVSARNFPPLTSLYLYLRNVFAGRMNIEAPSSRFYRLPVGMVVSLFQWICFLLRWDVVEEYMVISTNNLLTT